MENKLEQLLNSLVRAGWKPFGWEARGVKKGVYNNLYYGFETHPELYHIRLLTSRSSGLWQFVCENGMVEEQKEEKLIEIYDNLRGRTEMVYDDGEYQYRLIESALCDEDKLEEFLLNSIKLD